MRAKTSATKIHICRVCKKLFDTEAQLSRHSKSHEGSSKSASTVDSRGTVQFSCDQCDEVFSQESSLKRHTKHSHPPPKANSAATETVMESEQSDSEKGKTQGDDKYEFQCQNCQKSFRVKRRMDSHICQTEQSGSGTRKKTSPRKVVNLSKRKGTDDSTDVSEPKIAKTDSKVASVESETTKIFTCQECFKEFASKSSLNGHMASHRKSIEPGMKTGDAEALGESTETVTENVGEENDSADQDKSKDGAEKLPAADTQTPREGQKDAVDEQNEEPQPEADDGDESPSLAEVVNECITVSGAETKIKEEPEEMTAEAMEQQEQPLDLFENSCDPDGDNNGLDLETVAESSASDSPKTLSLKNVVGKLFECDLCDEVFSQKTMLENHVKIIHFGRIHRCEECSVEFKQKANLVRHMSRMHGDKPFQCDGCSKSFPSKYDLTRHLKTHSTAPENLKDIIHCPQCDMVFVYKKDLRMHRKKEHKITPQITDEPPVVIPDYIIKEHGEAVCVFRCSLCPRAFTLKTDLHRHFLIHSGEKPFGCDRCDSRFNRKSNLMRHKRLMHQIMEEGTMRVKMERNVTMIARRKKRDHPPALEPWEEEIKLQDEEMREWEENEIRLWEKENAMQGADDDEDDYYQEGEEEDDETHWVVQEMDADGNEENEGEVTFFDPNDKITVRILTFE